MNTVEVIVPLAPDEFRRIQGGNDIEEQGRAAFDCLEHEIGNGPDVFVAGMSREVTVIDCEDDEQAGDCPEGNLAGDGADAKACQRQVLHPGGTGTEELTYPGQPCRHQRANRSIFFCILKPGFRGTPSL